MPKISEAYLYKTYFAESRLSDPPKYRYGKRRTLVSTSYAIVQQADTPRLGREKVDFKSGEIDLRQIDFRNAQVTLKASREIRTGTTTSFIKTGADPDHLSAGRQVQFWYGSQVSTGAGADSIVIDHTTTNAANYLGDIMLVGGSLDMGADDDQILISAYSRGNLSATNEPGLTIRREIYPNSGILNMGPGDDLIRIDSYYSTSLSVSTGCVLLMGEGNDTIDLLTGGMVIHGAIDMGAGDDRFLISELSSSYTAHVQRGDYTLDPIINGGDGTDTIALPDNYYTVSTDREGTRIRNDTSSGSPGSIDVTLSSFEMITGTDLNAKAITITDGRIEIMGRSIQYV